MAGERRKLNVLVVEDDNIFRKLLVIELKKRGHTVLEYADTVTALDSVRRENPPLDAAVIDLMNRGYGGNMGDELRQMPGHENIHVFYFSALTKGMFNDKILDAPNTCYVHKEPGSFEVLIEKIDALADA